MRASHLLWSHVYNYNIIRVMLNRIPMLIVVNLHVVHVHIVYTHVHVKVCTYMYMIVRICILLSVHVHVHVYHTGSNLDQLSSLIHKLLPHASGLLYTRSHLPLSTSSPHHHLPQLPRITGVISHLGEKLELYDVRLNT